jgi:hypothetical protein
MRGPANPAALPGQTHATPPHPTPPRRPQVFNYWITALRYVSALYYRWGPASDAPPRARRLGRLPAPRPAVSPPSRKRNPSPPPPPPRPPACPQKPNAPSFEAASINEFGGTILPCGATVGPAELKFLMEALPNTSSAQRNQVEAFFRKPGPHCVLDATAVLRYLSFRWGPRRGGGRRGRARCGALALGKL